MNKIHIAIAANLYFVCLLLIPGKSYSQNAGLTGSWSKLKADVEKTGKPEWQEMLQYVASLHEKSTHPAQYPFPYDWEEIGPGYTYGPAFGHWDIVHQSLDVLSSYPQHSIQQLLNDITNQEPSGLIPGSIWMPGAKLAKEGKATWNTSSEGHPPVWVFAVNEYIKQTGDIQILNKFYTPLVKQISWFENERRADGEGFYYNDILTKNWESGIDQGVRFDADGLGRWACIDATSHVYFLYHTAASWAKILQLPSEWAEKREHELKSFIRDSLYVQVEGFFYDIWAVKNDSLRHLNFEAMWPIVVGAATSEQANRFIDEYLMDTTCFLTPHPISTVGKKDPKFKLQMWRGPVWNSMTYWAAIGCINYGWNDAARILLEKALDASAVQFKCTGTIWEFYHPFGGNPEDVARKPKKQPNMPCKDYLGHNPLIAMSHLYDSLLQSGVSSGLKSLITDASKNVTDSSGFVGKIIPGEMKTWIDDSTGYEITQWTKSGTSHHPYFTVESFIDNETAIIFSRRTGRDQLYKLNLTNGEMTQMTTGGKLRNIDHLPQFKTVWYLDGKKLFSLNTTDLKSVLVYDFEAFPFKVGSFSVSCDARWFIFAVEKKDSLSGVCGYGPYAIYKLNLEDKLITQVSLEMGFNISHVQANPVDPNLILYCWQWEKFDRERLVGHSPIRSWWVNIDGTDGGPFKQKYGTQQTHEAWTPDGKNITYLYKYRWGALTGTHYLGIQSIDGTTYKSYQTQVSPGHQNLFKDNKHWIVDTFNNDETLLALIKIGKNKIEESDILFRHGSTMLGQDSHPHPRFSPNGKYVLFSTDKTGQAQVYTVRINLDSKK
ncbi:MAG: oligogalacturonate lyase family protein [Bacteroidales bacterium]|nr:oligogalacturonate lyase family protein [Bacteroidales bacterium]